MPIRHVERPQMLKYRKKGRYYAHYDAQQLDPKVSMNKILKKFGFDRRMTTVFLYLNTVPAGGETNFPRADNDDEPRTLKKCYEGLMVTPITGSAILWYNIDPSGSFDKHSLHAACRVKKGFKYSMNFWVQNQLIKDNKYEQDLDHDGEQEHDHSIHFSEL
eukprot:gnl/TRDRNA2_/TRDRNA2_81226_c0_seq3.p2 gnl/TRDRNA2_/TRDRNA2_81226_c0~~gnl/TRDRNA2_/TRDRNA2_81226_c0_seq3.p2  ORF type:complete len:161 (-),score=20.29 gnl/TRDRNA2_/TRDRNA2_81226_c0_seq3:58-540(-)